MFSICGLSSDNSQDRLCHICSIKQETQQVHQIVLKIQHDTSIFSIAEQLVQRNVIKKMWPFVLYGLFTGSYKKIKAGQYCFTEKMKIKEIFTKLTKGLVIIHKVTIPEGVTVYTVKKILYKNPCLSGEILSLPSEGYVFPGTYYFSQGDKRQNMLNKMSRYMKEKLTKLTSNYLNTYEILIMSSIVEKETSIPEEKSIIAGVFLSRIQKKMRLQADPTVIYALTNGRTQLQRQLTRKDWKVQSPYNTYTNHGLPPTPICCPGIDTLISVANAKPVKYLYFVAGDNGHHLFSESLQNHNKNVNKRIQCNSNNRVTSSSDASSASKLVIP
jgi:UPF0755 protein